MPKKYKTKIEITAPAENKDEAIEILGDYLSGNITSGIDMKCTTRQVRFYDHSAAKAVSILLLLSVGFLFNVKTASKENINIGTCQTAAVQAPLNTSNTFRDEAKFKKEWEDRQTREALNFIKK